MVHLVPDEGVDSGPVLAQEIVPIHDNDTLETFETRIIESNTVCWYRRWQELCNGNQ